MIIKDSREDRDPTAVGKDFYPVGSFVGMAAMSTIENVTLEDVTISAPIAGGVAGYVGNSTVRNILATDDLVVSNDIDITPYDGNFAGNVVGEMYSNDLRENYSTWPSEYTVTPGGTSPLTCVKDRTVSGRLSMTLWYPVSPVPMGML